MANESDLHEDFKREHKIQVGSPRVFGIVFCIVFLAIAIWPIANEGNVHLWSIMIAGLLLLLAIFIPDSLQPLNRMWFRFGLLLHKVVNPIILGLLFFFTIPHFLRPTGLRPCETKASRGSPARKTIKSPQQL